MTARAVLLAVALSLALAACATTEEQVPVATKSEAAQGAKSDEATKPEATPRSREAPDPKAKFTSSCDLLLPDDVFSGDYALTGTAKVRNTGNVGVAVKVNAHWDQSADDDITDSKTVRIARGKTRSVKFKEAVTQQQVSQFQGSPDYFNGDACKITVKVTDTFGKTPFEN